MSAIIIMNAARRRRQDEEEDKKRREKKRQEDEAKRKQGLMPEHTLLNPDTKYEHRYRKISTRKIANMIGISACLLTMFCMFGPYTIDENPEVALALAAIASVTFLIAVALRNAHDHVVRNGDPRRIEIEGYRFLATHSRAHYVETWVPDPNFRPNQNRSGGTRNSKYKKKN